MPKNLGVTRISIHALHEEGDSGRAFCITNDAISIHALHEEGDFYARYACRCTQNISIHALHEEGDPSRLS